MRSSYADAAGLGEIVDIKEEELLDLATQIKLKVSACHCIMISCVRFGRLAVS